MTTDEGSVLDLLYVRGAFSASIIAIELGGQAQQAEVEATLERLAARSLAEKTSSAERWRLTEAGNRIGYERKASQAG